MKNSVKYLAFACVLNAALLSQTNAVIVFPFNTVHSGATPGGPAPWAVMTITNIAGGVQISLTNSATNPPGQFIGKLHLLFNILPASFDFTSDPFVDSISLGSHVDAGLTFNVEVDFKNAPPPARLLPGLTSTFRLFGVSESDFAGLNNSAMVHIQGIPPRDESSKVIAPEPGSLIAIGTGLASLLGLRRRKK